LGLKEILGALRFDLEAQGFAGATDPTRCRIRKGKMR
jgi:hypothetical protein